MIHIFIQGDFRRHPFMNYYLALTTPQPFTGDQRGRPFHLQQGERSIWILGKPMAFYFKVVVLMAIPIWLEVLGDDGSWLNDSGFLGEVCLGEGLLITGLLAYSKEV
jgi:hypothetical protein